MPTLITDPEELKTAEALLNAPSPGETTLPGGLPSDNDPIYEQEDKTIGPMERLRLQSEAQTGVETSGWGVAGSLIGDIAFFGDSRKLAQKKALSDIIQGKAEGYAAPWGETFLNPDKTATDVKPFGKTTVDLASNPVVLKQIIADSGMDAEVLSKQAEEHQAFYKRQGVNLDFGTALYDVASMDAESEMAKRVHVSSRASRVLPHEGGENKPGFGYSVIGGGLQNVPYMAQYALGRGLGGPVAGIALPLLAAFDRRLQDNMESKYRIDPATGGVKQTEQGMGLTEAMTPSAIGAVGETAMETVGGAAAEKFLKFAGGGILKATGADKAIAKAPFVRALIKSFDDIAKVTKVQSYPVEIFEELGTKWWDAGFGTSKEWQQGDLGERFARANKQFKGELPEIAASMLLIQAGQTAFAAPSAISDIKKGRLAEQDASVKLMAIPGMTEEKVKAFVEDKDAKAVFDYITSLSPEQAAAAAKRMSRRSSQMAEEVKKTAEWGDAMLSMKDIQSRFARPSSIEEFQTDSNGLRRLVQPGTNIEVTHDTANGEVGIYNRETGRQSFVNGGSIEERLDQAYRIADAFDREAQGRDLVNGKKREMLAKLLQSKGVEGKYVIVDSEDALLGQEGLSDKAKQAVARAKENGAIPQGFVDDGTEGAPPTTFFVLDNIRMGSGQGAVGKTLRNIVDAATHEPFHRARYANADTSKIFRDMYDKSTPDLRLDVVKQGIALTDGKGAVADTLKSLSASADDSVTEADRKDKALRRYFEEGVAYGVEGSVSPQSTGYEKTMNRLREFFKGDIATTDTLRVLAEQAMDKAKGKVDLSYGVPIVSGVNSEEQALEAKEDGLVIEVPPKEEAAPATDTAVPGVQTDNGAVTGETVAPPASPAAEEAAIEQMDVASEAALQAPLGEAPVSVPSAQEKPVEQAEVASAVSEPDSLKPENVPSYESISQGTEKPIQSGSRTATTRPSEMKGKERGETNAEASMGRVESGSEGKTPAGETETPKNYVTDEEVTTALWVATATSEDAITALTPKSRKAIGPMVKELSEYPDELKVIKGFPYNTRGFLTKVILGRPVEKESITERRLSAFAKMPGAFKKAKDYVLEGDLYVFKPTLPTTDRKGRSPDRIGQLKKVATEVREASAKEPMMPAEVEKKPTAQMTPEEFVASTEGKYKDSNAKLRTTGIFSGEGAVIAPNKQAHVNTINNVSKRGEPVNASAVDTYGIKLPEGYVREGDLYVFKPAAQEQKPTPPTPPSPKKTISPPAPGPEAQTKQQKSEQVPVVPAREGSQAKVRIPKGAKVITTKDYDKDTFYVGEFLRDNGDGTATFRAFGERRHRGLLQRYPVGPDGVQVTKEMTVPSDTVKATEPMGDINRMTPAQREAFNIMRRAQDAKMEAEIAAGKSVQADELTRRAMAEERRQAAKENADGIRMRIDLGQFEETPYTTDNLVGKAKILTPKKGSDADKLATAMKNIFKVDVVYAKPEEEVKMAASYYANITSAYPRPTITVNVPHTITAQDLLMAIVGHETGHHLSTGFNARGPVSHMDFLDAISKSANDKARQAAVLKEMYAKTDITADITEEGRADIVGSLFNNTAFWAYVKANTNKRNPALSSLADYAIEQLKEEKMETAPGIRRRLSLAETPKELEQALFDDFMKLLKKSETRTAKWNAKYPEDSIRMRTALKNDGYFVADNAVVVAPDDIRFRVSREQDAAYMDAVNRGDMDAAQKMVDEAAKGAGYILDVDHQTNERFVAFQAGELGFHLGTDIPEGMLGQETMRLKAGIKNPLRLEDAGVWDLNSDSRKSVITQLWQRDVLDDAEFADIRIRSEYEKKAFFDKWSSGEYDDLAYKTDLYRHTEFIRDAIKEKGYDGIVYKNEAEGNSDSFIAFEPSQLKSSDPVTRDDQGNVIPLSERFNEASDDIRFRVDQTNTPAFANWFKDSKVVDADGKPLVVYRFDDANQPTIFDSEEGGAVYFSRVPQRYFQKDGKPVRAFYLSANKLATPKDVAELGIDPMRNAINGDVSFLSSEEVDALKVKGFDGAVGPLGIGNGKDEFVVFSPTQIKSATANVGTFDPGNPDIRFRMAQKEYADAYRTILDNDLDFKLNPISFGLTPEQAQQIEMDVETAGTETDDDEIEYPEMDIEGDPFGRETPSIRELLTAHYKNILDIRAGKQTVDGATEADIAESIGYDVAQYGVENPQYAKLSGSIPNGKLIAIAKDAYEWRKALAERRGESDIRFSMQQPDKYDDAKMAKTRATFNKIIPMMDNPPDEYRRPAGAPDTPIVQPQVLDKAQLTAIYEAIAGDGAPLSTPAKVRADAMIQNALSQYDEVAVRNVISAIANDRRDWSVDDDTLFQMRIFVQKRQANVASYRQQMDAAADRGDRTRIDMLSDDTAVAEYDIREAMIALDKSGSKRGSALAILQTGMDRNYNVVYRVRQFRKQTGRSITVEEYRKISKEADSDSESQQKNQDELRAAIAEEEKKRMGDVLAKMTAEFDRQLAEAFRKGADDERKSFEYVLNDKDANMMRRSDPTFGFDGIDIGDVAFRVTDAEGGGGSTYPGALRDLARKVFTQVQSEGGGAVVFGARMLQQGRAKGFEGRVIDSYVYDFLKRLGAKDVTPTRKAPVKAAGDKVFKDPTKQRAYDVKEAVRQAVAEDIAAVGGDAKKLKTGEQIATRALEILEQKGKEWSDYTVEELYGVITGYPVAPEPDTRDGLERRYAMIRRHMLAIQRIEGMENNKYPKAMTNGQDAPDTTLRQLSRDVRDMMNDFPFPSDAENPRLVNAQKALENRLKYAIEELDKAVNDTKQPINEMTPRAVKETPEIKRLRDILRDLRAAYEAMPSVEAISEVRETERARRNAGKRFAFWSKRLEDAKAGVYPESFKGTTIPEIDAEVASYKAKAEVARQDYWRIKKESPQERLAALTEKVTKAEARLASLEEALAVTPVADPSPKKAPFVPANAEEAKAQEKLDAAREAIDRVRKAISAKWRDENAEKIYAVKEAERFQYLSQKADMIERKIKAKDFTKAPKRQPVTSGRIEIAREKVRQGQRTIEEKIQWQANEAAGWTGKAKNYWEISGNVYRFFKASYDFSNVGVQSMRLFNAHPLFGMRLIKEVGNHSLTDEKMAEFMAVMHSDPDYEQAYGDGLALDQQFDQYFGTGMGEAFFRNLEAKAKGAPRGSLRAWAGVVPKGMLISQRAFDMYGRAMRFEVYKSIVNDPAHGSLTAMERKAIANAVNIMGGVGNTKMFNHNFASFIGDLMWSSRLFTSQLQTAMGGGGLFWNAGLGPEGSRANMGRKWYQTAAPGVAKLYARSMAGNIAIAGLFASVGMLLGDRQPWEDEETLFWKAYNFLFGRPTIGGKTFDFSGGLTTYVTLARKLVLDGEHVAMSGRVVSDEGFAGKVKVMSNFFRGRLRPDLALAINIAFGEDVTGEKFGPRGGMEGTWNMVKEGASPITPLAMIETVGDLYKTHGWSGMAFGLVPSLAGDLFGAGKSSAPRDPRYEIERHRSHMGQVNKALKTAKETGDTAEYRRLRDLYLFDVQVNGSVDSLDRAGKKALKIADDKRYPAETREKAKKDAERMFATARDILLGRGK